MHLSSLHFMREPPRWGSQLLSLNNRPRAEHNDLGTQTCPAQLASRREQHPVVWSTRQVAPLFAVESGGTLGC